MPLFINKQLPIFTVILFQFLSMSLSDYISFSRLVLSIFASFEHILPEIFYTITTRGCAVCGGVFFAVYFLMF